MEIHESAPDFSGLRVECSSGALFTCPGYCIFPDHLRVMAGLPMDRPLLGSDLPDHKEN